MTENKPEIFSIDNLKKKILPFLYTVINITAIADIYVDSVAYCIPFIALFTLAFFMCYDFIGAHKKLGIPVYLGVSFIVLLVINLLMNSAESKMDYVEWFLSGGVFVETNTQFLWSTIIGFTFFISSVVYYFTHAIYRVSILTLVILIPCAISVKAAQTFPAIYTVLLASLNLFIYIYQNHIISVKKHVPKGKNASLTGYIDFAVAAVLVALIIPKPSETPYYEKFEEFSTRYSLSGKYGQMEGTYTKTSGNADNYLQMEDKVLYIVSTTLPQYFKIQVFDIYDSNMHYWTYGNQSSNGFRNWSNEMELLDYSKLLSAYKQADSSILTDIPSDKLENIENTPDEDFFARVKAIDFPSKYIISPIRIKSLAFLDGVAEQSYRTVTGELFPDIDTLPDSAGYDIYFYNENYPFESGWIYSGLCNMTMNEYRSQLISTMDSLDRDDPLYDTVNEFYSEYYDAIDFAASNYEKPSDEIKALADEITTGLEYDWEKAAAIENYFQTNGFIYDLAYRAPDGNDTPEFFITQSKRGTCSDFATAYCLLARAAGLTVRYVEGFVPNNEENNINGIYQINTTNAHAYPEVFIPGAGWLIYEPTVGGANSVQSNNDGNDDTQTDYLAVFVTSVAIFLSIATIVILILLAPKIEEALFGLRIRLISPDKAILLLYGRFVMRAGKISGMSFTNMTVEQVRCFCEPRSSMSVTDITQPFEKTCYGKINSEKQDIILAYQCYKMQIKALKKYKKKKHK